MIPGEYRIEAGDIELNVGRRTLSLSVVEGAHPPTLEGNAPLKLW